MKIKIGDSVRFLNEVGGGVVQRIIDRQLVEIKTKDGWLIPYQVTELVVIPENPDQVPYRGASHAYPALDSDISRDERVHITSDIKLFLLVSHEKDMDGQSEGFHWYLVNDSNYYLQFSFYEKLSQGARLVEHDELEPRTKILLQETRLSELTDVDGFHLQGIMLQDEPDNIPPLIDFYLKFTIKKFTASGNYKENDFLHDPAMLIQIGPMVTDERNEEDNTDLAAIIEEKDSSIGNTKKGQSYKSGIINELPREVDLHINQLVDSVVGMSNREILSVQMEHFEQEINLAITNNKRAIIFIHGIGNGTLKESLRNTLIRDYPICSFEDASFKEYGFGATMVRIRQNK